MTSDASTTGRHRALPPTHHVERRSATEYVLHFSEAQPGLLTRCLRHANAYEFPLQIVIAPDKLSMTLTLPQDQPDNDLALLRYLTAIFRPTLHHGKIVGRTAVSLAFTLTDGGRSDDLWPLAAIILGLPELAGKVEKVFMEGPDCVIKLVKPPRGERAMDAAELTRILRDNPDVNEFLTLHTP